MHRTLVLFLTLLLLWAGVAQVNHALTGAHVHLFAGGLFVAYAALMLPLQAGLVVSILAGGVCDATTPVPFGTHLLLFAGAHALIFTFRERLPHDHTRDRVRIVLLANLALFLAFSLLEIGRSPILARLWPRLIADLVCSEVFLALIAPWFLALQARAAAMVPDASDAMF